MNQIKIGKFISRCRKNKNMTQNELAEKLDITDRAISKWETGKGMPDSSIMLKLCEILEINVNELLCGNFIETAEYEKKSEENLLLMRKEEEDLNKKLMLCEDIIIIISTIYFILSIIILFLSERYSIIEIISLIFSFIIFLFCVFFSLKLETEVGYYICRKCNYKYIPKYKDVFFSMHLGKTRYLKCPKCNKFSWNKKCLISKDRDK